VINIRANLKLPALLVPEIWRGSQNSKTRSCDPLPTAFDLILHFLLVLLVFYMRTKFEVSIVSSSRDKEGSQKL